MRITDWLNWSGGYTIPNFSPLDNTANPISQTSYVMFSLPAYPCLKSADGSYGNIQAFGYQNGVNLGRIPISQFKKDGNTIYYIMPNLTSKGLAYSNAIVYICSPIQNAPSQLDNTLLSKFVIADLQGSGNATAKTYTLSLANSFIVFINPTLFYGNESIYEFYDYSNMYGRSWQYNYINPQQILATGYYGTWSLNQLANNKIYIFKVLATYSDYQYGTRAYTMPVWSNTEGIYGNLNDWSNWHIYNSTTNQGNVEMMIVFPQLVFKLPYDAHATIVNYFTTKYQIGNLTAVGTTTSNNNNGGVSNPVILPTSPKLNLSITNTTLTNNLNNLKQQFNKQIVVYGMSMPLGLIYIIDLFVIIALAVFSKHEGAFIIVLAIFWFSGLLFIQQLVIAAIITIAYATYRLEGIFHKEG